MTPTGWWSQKEKLPAPIFCFPYILVILHWIFKMLVPTPYNTDKMTILARGRFISNSMSVINSLVSIYCKYSVGAWETKHILEDVINTCYTLLSILKSRVAYFKWKFSWNIMEKVSEYKVNILTLSFSLCSHVWPDKWQWTR